MFNKRDYTVVLRSSTRNELKVPKIKRDSFRNSFSCAGPVAWNVLPDTIREAMTLEHFKRLCKNYVHVKRT